MSFPDPHPGLVIRYAYLWKREHDEGREDGSKDRPCSIVLSVLAALRGFEGQASDKRLISQGAAPAGRHYTGVAEAA